MEWIKDALKQSHRDEESYVKSELKRLQSEQTRNDTRLHQIYEDKLNGVVPVDFFQQKFREIRKRQKEISSEIAKLEQKNLSYMEEGIMILEMMKNLKNQYLRANLEQKAKMMKILLSKCELKGVNTSFQWSKPFDILFEMGQTGKWGE